MKGSQLKCTELCWLCYKIFKLSMIHGATGETQWSKDNNNNNKKRDCEHAHIKVKGWELFHQCDTRFLFSFFLNVISILLVIVQSWSNCGLLTSFVLPWYLNVYSTRGCHIHLQSNWAVCTPIWSIQSD